MKNRSTITAAQIAERLPMTVLQLNPMGLFHHEKITFIRVSMVGGWHLMGTNSDRSKRVAIFDKDDTFGVIEEKRTEVSQWN